MKKNESFYDQLGLIFAFKLAILCVRGDLKGHGCLELPPESALNVVSSKTQSVSQGNLRRLPTATTATLPPF